MGTDYPYDIAEYNPIGHIASVNGMDETTLAQLAGGNAMRLLQLASTSSSVHERPLLAQSCRSLACPSWGVKRKWDFGPSGPLMTHSWRAYPFLGAERTSSRIVEVFRRKPEGGASTFSLSDRWIVYRELAA